VATPAPPPASPVRPGGTPRRAGAALAGALVITAAQTLLACALAGGGSLPEAYRKLANWDSGWYRWIAEGGYTCPPVITPGNTGNVAFLPGYPVAARLLRRATGLDTRDALLVTSQVSCVAFWAYLLLLFARWGAPPRAALPALLVAASHPAAFYLVVGYSEALFMAALLGYLYWAGSGARGGLLLAAVHGFVMTATRLVGAPLVVVPLLPLLLHGRAGGPLWPRCRRLLPLAAVAAVAGSGTLLFFVYCRLRFGRWDAYMQTELAGWGVRADYLAFFRKKTWQPGWPRRDHGYIMPQWFDHQVVPCVVLLLAVMGWLEWRLLRSRPDTGWRWRAGLYAAAAMLFFLNVCGRSCLDLAGMIRYAYPILVLFVLAATHLVARVGLPRGRARNALVALLVAWVPFGLVTQMVFIWRFARSLWVA
jgi:hypothetical protein